MVERTWPMRLHGRSFPTVVAFTLSAIMTLGCNSTDRIHGITPEDDASIIDEIDGSDAPDTDDSNVGEPDADIPNQGAPDTDDLNTNESGEEVLVTTVAPAGGALLLQTEKHHLRLIVAPRGGADRVSSTSHRIMLGAGEAQHSQGR